MTVSLRRGDIFSTVDEHNEALVVIFGRSGFNGLSMPFRMWQERRGFEMAGLPDRWGDERHGNFVRLGPQLWLVCYCDGHEDGFHGISKPVLSTLLEKAYLFARQHRINTIVTNGEHDLEPYQQCAPSEMRRDVRAKFLIGFAYAQTDLDTVLVTEGNVFIRNAPVVIDHGPGEWRKLAAQS